MARWIAVAMLGVCVNAGATSYYVSNGGADGNNGTSAGTAWRTLAHVNAQTFNPGDTIYLQRGDLEGAVDSAIIGNERKFHQV